MAYLLEAIARDKVGDQAAAGAAIERALDIAEPDGVVMPFLMYPAPGLLERHTRRPTAHASMLAEIRNLLSGTPPSPPAQPRPLLEALSESEIRVLRYMPTNLRVPEIARELYVSPNTVKTHTRHLYAKLGPHSRTEAIERARDLGLLAPSGTRAAQRQARGQASDQATTGRLAPRSHDLVNVPGMSTSMLWATAPGEPIRLDGSDPTPGVRRQLPEPGGTCFLI
jgi:DNA-binding CsgD family transcriptional regulator